MTQDEHNAHSGESQPSPTEKDVYGELEHIEKALSGEIAGDPRLGSGVPDHLRGADSDFLAMSGLEDNAVESQPRSDDLDPSKPVSFYERGVADVDSSMAPGTMEDAYRNGEDVNAKPQPKAMGELRDIIADLTRDIAGEPERPSVPDSPTDDEVEKTVIAMEQSAAEETRLRPVDPVLSKAEQLLEELDAPPPKAPDRNDLIVQEPSATTPETPAQTAPQNDWPVPSARLGSYEDRQDTASHRKRRKPRNRRLRRAVGATAVIAALLAGAFVAYRGANYFESRFRTPTKLFNHAAALASKGDFKGAVQAYEEFAGLNGTHPLHAEALFAAAVCMQQQATGNANQKQPVLIEAQGKFQRFIDAYPTHNKVARARVLIGRLLYETGAYQQAMDALEDPELRLLDPGSTVPILRTIARSHAKMGQYDLAQTAYLQAASTTGNLTPDVDFEELGSLYQSLSENAPDDETRKHYQTLAMEQWDRVVRVSGVDPATKNAMRVKLDVMRDISQKAPAAVIPEQNVQPESAAPVSSLDPVEDSAMDSPLGGAQDPAETVGQDGTIEGETAELPVPDSVIADAPAMEVSESAAPEGEEPLEPAAVVIPDTVASNVADTSDTEEPADTSPPGHAPWEITPPGDAAAAVVENPGSETGVDEALPEPTPDADEAAPMDAAPEDSSTSLLYHVLPGDTLEKIAKRYNMTEQEILDLNELTNSNLRVGQVLLIDNGKPADAAASTGE
ncbi:MAG: hypothetical protein AMXMBFR84_04420 [Candidatus Hydrogenedentota bacterium]